MNVIRNNLIIIFLLIFVACTNNTVRDYTTLKQKALEIPPEFDLTPPVEGKENVDEEDVVSSTSEDLEDILGQTVSEETSSDGNQNQSLDEFIDQNFVSEKINDSTTEISQDIQIEEPLVAEELTEVEDQNLSTVDEDSTSVEDNIESFSEEQFIENLSNTDEITSLPEEEQLKPEILDDSIYEDTPTFSSDDELNDLLNRVDDLLNTYSN